MGTPLKVVKPTAKAAAVNGTVEAVLLEAPVDTAQRHAFIPDPKYAKSYVHRRVNGIDDFKLLEHCRANGINLLLMGDTGAGKTMFPMAYAAQHSIPYYSVPCDVSIDPTALFGKMMPGSKIGEFEWVDGPVTELVRNGGILNISEVNFMPAKIAASLYSLLDHRRSVQLLGHQGEHVNAHRDLLVVADMNPKYRGTVDLNIAFNNRFGIKVAWDYDAAVEDKLVKSKSLLDLVRKMRAQDDIRTPIGTNLMMGFVSVASTLGMKFATENFVLSFADGERDAVRKSIDVASVNIAEEIAKLSGAKTANSVEVQDMAADPSWFKQAEFRADDYQFEPVP